MKYLIRCTAGSYEGDILSKGLDGKPTLSRFEPMTANLLKAWIGSKSKATKEVVRLNSNKTGSKYEIEAAE